MPIFECNTSAYYITNPFIASKLGWPGWSRRGRRTQSTAARRNSVKWGETKGLPKKIYGVGGLCGRRRRSRVWGEACACGVVSTGSRDPSVFTNRGKMPVRFVG